MQNLPRPAVPKRHRRPVTSEASALRSLFAELTSFGARGGAALGHAYARVARSLLSEVERIEDASAERRLRQRSHASRAPIPQGPPRR